MRVKHLFNYSFTITFILFNKILSVEELPSFKNSSKLLSKEELINLFKTIHGNHKRLSDELITVGLVGYPNVGKSSTINTLLLNKKVSVSSTPGKTKHFQVYS
jgi:large subunit GTPase 1